MERDVYAKIVAKLKKIADDLQNLPDVSSLEEKIGDLTGLDTTAKTDLVSAINEVLGDIPDVSSLETAIGDLTDLDTTAKTDLVNAINEVLGDIPTLPTYETSGPYTKYGKMVFVNEYLWISASSVTVPEGYRPANNATFVCVQRTSSAAGDVSPAKITFGTDGSVSAEKAEYYGCFSWLTA